MLKIETMFPKIHEAFTLSLLATYLLAEPKLQELANGMSREVFSPRMDEVGGHRGEDYGLVRYDVVGICLRVAAHTVWYLRRLDFSMYI
jgi:hypothetical protein